MSNKYWIVFSFRGSMRVQNLMRFDTLGEATASAKNWAGNSDKEYVIYEAKYEVRQTRPPVSVTEIH